MAAAGTGGSAGTKGFLFSDLRGYTAFVERAGDQAAAELLATYRSVVREVIARHDGAEIKTEGDSFYVVFPNASAAVEAGLSIVAAAAEQNTPQRPIRVGVGVHAGETVATTEGLVGGAVNIAARVCAKAQPGELLVTDTVRALTRTFLPYRYTSLGTQQLKGIAGGIPLYRVEPSPTTTRARLRRQLSARRGRVLVVAGLLVVLLGVGAGVYAANRAPDCLSLLSSTKDVVAKIDSTRNCVVATYPVGRRPGKVIEVDGNLWVSNEADRTLTQLGPTGSLMGVVTAGGDLTDIAVDDTSLWALNGQYGILTRIDRRTGLYALSGGLPAIETQFGGPGYLGLTTAGGRVLVTDGSLGRLLQVSVDLLGGTTADNPYKWSQIDPAPPPDAGQNGEHVAVPGTGPIVSADRLWIGHADDPRLTVAEPDGTVVKSVSVPDAAGGARQLVPVEGAVWVVYEGGRLARIATRTFGVQTAEIGRDAFGLAVGRSGVWTTSPVDRTLVRTDPESMETVTKIPTGGIPAGVATLPDGSVWVALHAP